MEIEVLYKKVYCACVEFAVYQKKNIKERIIEFWPVLGVFAKQFFEKSDFEFEEEYLQLRQVLLEIINDIVQGMEQEDIILLQDAVEFGLKEFLEIFISSEEELRQLREESFSEEGSL